MTAKRRKSKHERQIPYHLYVESKMWHKWSYLWSRIGAIESRLVLAKGERMGLGVWDWQMQPCIHRMDKWDPSVCTENYLQHPVLNHNGKEYEKDYICVCVCCVLFCILVYVYIYTCVCVYIYTCMLSWTHIIYIYK